MECSDPSFFFLFDNINVSSFTELHEYPLPTSDFQLRPTHLYSGLSSPNSQFPPSPSYHSPIQQQQNNAISCFPSPTNTIIEADKTSPLLQPYTVRSHSIEHHYHPIHPVLVPLHQKENTHQSILTTIDNNKKKSLGKKQKRMNELPYAPNLLNLQLTPPPKHIPTSSSHQKRVGSKIKSAGTMISTAPTKSTNNYRCDYPNCDKTFTRPYNLKSHRRTHTAERPFDCPLCSKSFARQHDRNRHAKLHLGIKPYTCQFCNKSFARQDALNRHQRMDTSSIPTCSRSIGGRRKRKPTPSSLLFCPS